MDSNPSPAVVPLQLAGARRRIIALFVDGLILMLIGGALGNSFADAFVALGAWGRVLGFAIAALYFGVLDSRIGPGASIGKLTLGIKVVDRDGRGISVARATLRFLPLGIAYFLNGAELPLALDRAIWAVPLSLIVGGIGLSALYLLLFNRASRQSLHDLLLDTYVIYRAGPPPRRVWRGHAVVCALIVAAAVAAPLTPPSMFGPRFASLADVQRALVAQPWVAYASVSRGISRYFRIGPQTGIRVVAVTVGIRDRNLDEPARYDQAARTVLTSIDDPESVDVITVTLQTGYDIGIAHQSLSQSQTHTVPEWRDRIGPAGYQI